MGLCVGFEAETENTQIRYIFEVKSSHHSTEALQVSHAGSFLKYGICSIIGICTVKRDCVLPEVPM
jgi:hypothetical protein